MSLKFILQKNQNAGFEPCECPLLGNNIAILSFNFDGKGNAAAIIDKQFKVLTPTQFNSLLSSGWYSFDYEEHGRPKFTADRFLLMPLPNGEYNLDENYELTNLDNSPILKHLLKLYISNKYQENADYSDKSLWAEYLRLKDDNGLNALFIEESADNTRRWV